MVGGRRLMEHVVKTVSFVKSRIGQTAAEIIESSGGLKIDV